MGIELGDVEMSGRRAATFRALTVLKLMGG
jgi:hypothetical protein